jgi:amino acid permease
MGRLFLPKYLGRAFDLAVLIVFVTTLISYSLAGGGAYSSLVGGSPQASIVPYVLGCSCYVIFVEPHMRAFMQALTAAKVVLLVVIIGLCGLVAGETGLRPHESWESASVLQPFLIGTVAIGGIADLMPYMLDERARASAQRITRFRRSVCVGVVACYLLNLLWAGFVLGIVPQRRSDAGPDDISLQDAAQRGEIATIPVTQIINAQFHSKFGWLAQAIVVFICLSVTVSFSAIGLGLKDVLSGFARSLNAALGLSEETGAEAEGEGVSEGEGDDSAGGQELFSAAFWMPVDGRGRRRLCGRAVELAIILVAFAAVLGVALSNPTGFLLVLGTFVSMALNLAGGVFISLMYVAARQRAGHLPVLVPLNERIGRVLAGFVVVSFNIAVLYDVHQASRSVLAEEFAGALTAAATALLVATSVWPVSRYVLFTQPAEPAAEALLAEG